AVVVAHEQSACAVGVCGQGPLLGLTVPGEAPGVGQSGEAPGVAQSGEGGTRGGAVGWHSQVAPRVAEPRRVPGTSPGVNQLASRSICSNSSPLVSGTNFHTKMIDNSAIVA